MTKTPRALDAIYHSYTKQQPVAVICNRAVVLVAPSPSASKKRSCYGPPDISFRQINHRQCDRGNRRHSPFVSTKALTIHVRWD